MASASLGTKRECTKCHAKFYDLGASPVVCPKCGAIQKEEKPKAAAKRHEPAKPKKIAPKPKPKPKDDEDDYALEEGAEELEDLDELDDAPEVISLEEVEDHQEDSEVDPNSDDAEDGMFIEDLQGNEGLFDALDPDADAEEEDEEESEDGDEDEPSSSRKRKKK